MNSGANDNAQTVSPPAEESVAPNRPNMAATDIPHWQLVNYIEMAAYYIAERRGFAPGNVMDDWMQAEAEIYRLISEGHIGRK
ncbi:MAG TPA: DUF2934 domain-containing protein [Rhodocyclaceae bacterium]|nr:DUF2934 domain-containing protein [Rhodocyclaceae bacterium]